MDTITNTLNELSISKKKVLYYSISFANYNEILKILIDTLNDKLKNIYVKTHDSYKNYNDDEKDKIEEKYLTFINKLKENEIFTIYKNTFYVINSEFHITTLFTSGKNHEKSVEMEEQMNKNVKVKLNKLAVSDDFIVLGVEYIKLEDNTDINYYGNVIKHITIALNKTGKKVFPKDSYTALTKGKNFDLDIIIDGKCSKVVQ